jgi:hypothetical protein
MNQGETADHSDVFEEAQADIRERLGRRIGHEPGRGFSGVGDEAGPARHKRDDHIEGRAGLTQDTNRKEGTADRPNDGVHGIPGRVDPGDFIGEKFQHVERARDPKDERIAENGERLVGWGEHNPVLINGEAGDENGQIKIDPGQTGKAKGNAEQLQLIHVEIMRLLGTKSRAFGG